MEIESFITCNKSWYSLISMILETPHDMPDHEFVTRSLINFFNKYGINSTPFPYYCRSFLNTILFDGSFELLTTYPLIDYIFDRDPFVIDNIFIFTVTHEYCHPFKNGDKLLRLDYILRMIDFRFKKHIHDDLIVRSLKKMYLFTKLLQYHRTKYIFSMPLFVKSSTVDGFNFKLKYSNLYELASSKCFRNNSHYTIASIIISNQYMRSSSLCDIVFEKLNN